VAKVKLVAVQPIRVGDTTYRPGQEFMVEDSLAKRLVDRKHVRLAASAKPRKETADDNPPNSDGDKGGEG